MESLLPQHSPFLKLAHSEDLIGFNDLLVEPQHTHYGTRPKSPYTNGPKNSLSNSSSSLIQKQHSPLLTIRRRRGQWLNMN
eukprot:scaffold81925_cov76-Cyclotella_meneghiniana.AAC.1